MYETLNFNLENCALRLFVLWIISQRTVEKNIKYLVFITTHTERIQYIFCIIRSIQTENQMFTWCKNIIFVNAELSTGERGAVVGRYAENEVVRSTARRLALTRQSWNHVMQSGWHHRSLCAAIIGFRIHLDILYKNVGSQSKKKPNIWNSASVSRRRMLATVVLCTGDFKLYFHTSYITPLQLVIELSGLEWTCV